LKVIRHALRCVIHRHRVAQKVIHAASDMLQVTELK